MNVMSDCSVNELTTWWLETVRGRGEKRREGRDGRDGTLMVILSYLLPYSVLLTWRHLISATTKDQRRATQPMILPDLAPFSLGL